MADSRICPVCKRPLPKGEGAARYRPFCSKRCADIDLGRWLKGSYAIPAVEAEKEGEGETAAEADDGDGTGKERGTRPPRQ